MADSAILKIQRATEHVAELNELFRQHPPFPYIVETNANSGERATRVKEDKAVIDRTAIIAGDAVHALRAALDHAYWEIVSPYTASQREERKVQFPFSKTAARLDEAITSRLADRVSRTFFRVLQDLKPHGERGGNELLYSIHQLDAGDKHKRLIPTADYKLINSDEIRQQVPDFPFNIRNISLVAGARSTKDIVWRTDPRLLSSDMIGTLLPPTTCIFEKKLMLPVDIVIEVGAAGDTRRMVPTLYKLVDVTRTTIDIIRSAK